MFRLRVDLQEGFADDEVDLRINGREALHKQGVTTKRMLGLATSAEIEVPEDGPVTVQVEVPTKHLSKSILLSVADSPHLGISILNGEIKFIVSRKAFGYA
jgi:hypothetical protein